MVIMSDELERRFREKAVKKFGGQKGYFGKAVEDAVETWLKQQK